MGKLHATYEVRAAGDEIERIARFIAVEQTVEVPEALVTERIEEEIVGDVEAIEPRGGDRFDVRIAYDAAVAGGQLPQLLNLVYGNVSLMDTIRLVGLELPDDLLVQLPGPNEGGAGLRAAAGVYDRPLLCGVIKPRGLPEERLAEIAGEMAEGGADLVKDDHNLIDDSIDAFERRVARCQAAVEEANAKTGRRCRYAVNLCAPADRIQEQVEIALRHGIRGVLVPPLVAGLDTVRFLAEHYPVFVISHPSFSGAYTRPGSGIEPGLLHGTLFRLAGVDVSVFVNHGGRFQPAPEECASIAGAVRAPLGALRPGLPAPAGGMTFDRLPDLARDYGAETVLLIGGALLTSGPSVRDATRELLDRVRAHFPERLEAPGSACEQPAVRRSEGDFTWKGRPRMEYKESDDLPFRGVTRHELVGDDDEATAFELRYFEIGPGGYSSREKHVFTHAIIAARGRGVLTIGERSYDLQPHDVAYVPPLAVHQVRNEAEKEPFGFFCIVDRERDAPQEP